MQAHARTHTSKGVDNKALVMYCVQRIEFICKTLVIRLAQQTSASGNGLLTHGALNFD